MARRWFYPWTWFSGLGGFWTGIRGPSGQAPVAPGDMPNREDAFEHIEGVETETTPSLREQWQTKPAEREPAELHRVDEDEVRDETDESPREA